MLGVILPNPIDQAHKSQPNEWGQIFWLAAVSWQLEKFNNYFVEPLLGFRMAPLDFSIASYMILAHWYESEDEQPIGVSRRNFPGFQTDLWAGQPSSWQSPWAYFALAWFASKFSDYVNPTTASQ